MNTSKNFYNYFLLYLALIFPSTHFFQKYFGIYYLILYAILGFIIFHLFFLKVKEYLKNIISEHLSFYLIIFTIVFLFVCFMVLYPMLDAGIVGGGSDNDQALNLATMELLNGKYPYYVKTYLGNPVSPMPGSLIFAAPFVLLGNSAYQNFFWLIVFVIISKKYLFTNTNVLLFLWVTIFLSPTILHVLFTGGDYLANSLYILILSLLLIQLITNSKKKRNIIFIAILLGISFSSRPNFIFIVPLLFSFLLRTIGFKKAMALISIVTLSCLGITLPFYLYDPAGFSPLHTLGKLEQYENILPHITIIVPSLTLMLATGLAVLKIGTLEYFIKYSTAVLALPVIFTVIISSSQLGAIDFIASAYGFYFLFFAALGFWPKENTPIQSPRNEQYSMEL